MARFVVQLHDASSLHFDLRLQSCAVYCDRSEKDNSRTFLLSS